MKREILFRGQEFEGSNWKEGSLLIHGAATYILPEYPLTPLGVLKVRVKPETVFQFTGAIDKNKVKIFEGDINNDKGVCFYNEDDASFCWRYGDLIAAFELESSWCTIIGNIHDNPELLNQ